MKDINEIREEKILEFIYSKEYKIMTAKQIAALFSVPKEDMKEFEKLINKLEVQGKLYIDESKRVCVPNSNSRYICVYEAKSKGFGFARVISSDSVEDIYISKENAQNAMDKDTVLVESFMPKEAEKSLEGRIIKIIKRGEDTFVGIVNKCDTFGFVEVVDNKMDDIYIPFKLLQGVENEDRVVVRLTKYPTANRKAEGKIIEVIGSKETKDIEQAVILKSNKVEKNFPKDVVAEAEKVAVTLEDDLDTRVDLTNQNIYTIDGDDAKDFDDAISIEKISDDEYKLGVHIADVSHYVKENSLLDKEAIKRGTSIYTPGMVIPMLPRSLSNEICSLQEGEKRLTLSIDMIINTKAEVTFSTIYKSVIKSKKRMTYNNVECVLKGENEEVLKEYEPFKKDIFLMKELADILRNKREARGSINFDIPETYFKLDNEGEPIDVMPYETGMSNNIIEEFMLIANKTVAKTFKELEAPFIYRIHETPDIEKLRELNEMLKNMGTSIKGINKIHPKALAMALETFKEDKKRYMVVSKLLLRTLKLAKYADVPLGHFGLNFTDYCHFTSPIRRYPDLFIHRVISKYIENGYTLDGKEYEKLKNKALKYAITSSDTEKTATKIERDFDDLFMAKYMAKHLGDEYTGVISSITNFGIYVKLDNTIEGLVTLSSLEDDYYIYNEKQMMLIGERTGAKFEIGNKVKVRVVRSSVELRRIDFVLVKE